MNNVNVNVNRPFFKSIMKISNFQIKVILLPTLLKNNSKISLTLLFHISFTSTIFFCANSFYLLETQERKIF